MEITGKSVFSGIAIGKLAIFQNGDNPVKREKITDSRAEIQRFTDAKEEAKVQLAALYEKALKEVGEVNAAIFEVHQMMLDDLDYIEAITNMIESQEVNAEYAVATTGDNFSAMFAAMDDDYMKARAADVKDISNRVITILQGNQTGGMDSDEPVILLANDLAPSETVQLDKSKVLSFVTRHGSTNSHTAILARTMNIPALSGIDYTEDAEGKHSRRYNGQESVYEGEIRNDERHGTGCLTYKNGYSYCGSFENNLYSGHGQMIDENKNVLFDGEFKAGKRCGKGIEYYPNGNVFEGEWKEDRREGPGVLKNKEGTVLYEGEWKEDLQCTPPEKKPAPEPVEEKKVENQSITEELLKKEKLTGKGKITFVNGDVYEGDYQNGYLCGHGKMTYISGNVYEGEWRDDKTNGKGKVVFSNGIQYTGDFVDNKRHGKGTIILDNGDVYDGDWKNNMMEGFGIMKFEDGNIYEGSWENNNRHGHGKMIQKNGIYYEGEWEDDEIVGPGTIYRSDGKALFHGDLNTVDIDAFGDVIELHE